VKGKGKRPDFYIVKSFDVAEKMDIDERSTGSTWYSYSRRKEELERWELLR